MELTLANVTGLVRLTLADPRQAARVVMRLPMPLQARWAAVALMAVLSAFLMQGMAALMPPAIGPDGQEVPTITPFFWAGMVGFGMVMTALLAFAVGRWRGGRGELADAVILVAWLQFIQLLIVVLQLVVLVVFPLLAPVVEVGAVLVFVWLLVNFVAEMHGFRSLGMVFLGIVLTFVAAVFGMTMLLMMLGIGP
jgi:hypothetical protein